MSETVLKFPSPEKRRAVVSQGRPTGSLRVSGTSVDEIVRTEVRMVGSLAVPIEIDKLYPAEEATRSELVRALQILAEARTMLDSAQQKIGIDDIIGADLEIGKFQLLLPQLFKYRAIGDGFGMIINAIEIALVNQKGRPLNRKQISAIWRVTKELRSHPFVTTEVAADQVDELAKVGLAVDPIMLGAIYDAEE